MAIDRDRQLFTLKVPEMEILKSDKFEFGGDCAKTCFTYIEQLGPKFWLIIGCVQEEGIESSQYPKHVYMLEGHIVKDPIKEAKVLLCDFVFNYPNGYKNDGLRHYFKIIYTRER